MDLAQSERPQYGGEDRRWMADVLHLHALQPITLDGNAFPAADYPDGTVMSGTPLAYDTVLKRHVPYDPTYDADPATAGIQSNGRDVCVGLLATSLSGVTAGRLVTGALYYRGRVRRAFLPKPLDAAGEADLPLIRFQEN